MGWKLGRMRIKNRMAQNRRRQDDGAEACGRRDRMFAFFIFFAFSIFLVVEILD